MPANLSPEYKAAEAAFRKAREPRERLEWLREMLRTIPKHKGTEHLQADIKARIKDLAEELEGPKRAGARGSDARHSSRRCCADCTRRPTECRQVLATRAAHRIRRT